ncbi:putative mRNA splicing protein, partial [Hortaea werneckii]
WANYCNFKLETTHDIDVIRELFERAKKSAGLDFLAHPFWDKYIEFEERIEAHDRVFEILSEIIHIPLHQYARYFERYRALSVNRSLAELAPANVIDGFRNELAGGMQQRTDAQMEQELRARIDQYHAEVFQQTQTETTKRWTYESEVKRPYYHVTDLDDAQLANWRKYLDFEESEGGYERTKFLYERCLVTAA